MTQGGIAKMKKTQSFRGQQNSPSPKSGISRFSTRRRTMSSSEEPTVKTPSKKGKAKTKDKLDPKRFSNDGVTFKGKLIGIEEVFEARGDSMCQEAMQKLKANVKTAGEHKQKITLKITLDGLKIIDDKSGKVEDEQAVHKISFISRDVTDARAFGYIYGSPGQKSHKFFAIKTEKTAENVVLTLRDLFQVVLEMKKKEMELAKKAQSENTTENNNKNEEEIKKEEKPEKSEPIYQVPPNNAVVGSKVSPNKEKVEEKPIDIKIEKPPETSKKVKSEESMGTLLDLETEMESLQQGIQDMDAFSTDPFDPWSQTTPITHTTTFPQQPDPFMVQRQPFLAPPPSVHAQILPHPAVSAPNPAIAVSSLSTVTAAPPQPQRQPSPFEAFPTPANHSTNGQPDKYSVFSDFGNDAPSTFTTGSVFDQAFNNPTPEAPPVAEVLKPELAKASSQENIFSDLDPLGKDRPYKERKDMFSEYKKPKKKTLMDLSGTPIVADNVSERGAIPAVKIQPPANFQPPATIQAQPPITLLPQPPPRVPPPFDPFSTMPTHPPPADPIFTATFEDAPPKPPRRAERKIFHDDPFSFPSPDSPPPPLPAEVQITLADQGPAPPPRPTSTNVPRIAPPSRSPRKAVSSDRDTSSLSSTSSSDKVINDPFASDPFFTSPLTLTKTDDPFAAFDQKLPSDPFKSTGFQSNTQEPLYATVNKTKTTNS